MWWPFSKKKRVNKKENEQNENLYVFEPKEDVTAYECALFLSDLTSGIKSERYINSIPIDQRRHFRKI